MRAPSKIKNILSVALVLALGIFLTACAATKITDPADPRFNSEQFRFEDYMVSDPTADFQKMFPVGTPKSHVDYVLIEIGGAKSKEMYWTHYRENGDKKWQKKEVSNTFSYEYTYVRPLSFGWHWGVTVKFDDKNRLKTIQASGGAISPL